ncbi:hypothetical protein ScPMuIL_015919, partial [Solemya velum]
SILTQHIDEMMPNLKDSFNETTTIGFGVTEKNSTSDEAREYWDVAQTAIFGLWLSVSMLFAIIGNLMVIMVVIRHRGMRTRTNMFLVNLAAADFFVGCLMAPFSLATLIKEEWQFGEIMCTINGFLNAVCTVTSIHTLMYISIHKYFSIIRPLSSRHLNKTRILGMIVAAWMWAIICGILTVTGLSKVLYKPGTMQCGPEYPHTLGEYIHHGIIQTTNILIPLVIMIYAYTKIFREIREHTVRLRENSTLEKDNIIAQQKRVAVTLFMVLVCFIVCWLPYHVYTMYVTFEKDKESIPGFANALAYCFGYMNSACNPIIYAWRSSAFREGYKQILCQTPNYVISDDTVQADSPSALRRLSVFFRGRLGTRRASDLSEESVQKSRSSVSSSPLPFQSLIKKSLSKTARGSSVIRRDGSVVITKNGKIVSVQSDRAHSKVYYPSEANDQFSEVSQTDAATKENEMDIIVMKPLMENGYSKLQDESSAMKFSKSETSFGHHNEALDDISDTEIDSSKTNMELNGTESIHICIENVPHENNEDKKSENIFFGDVPYENSGDKKSETFFFGETTIKKDLEQNCFLLNPLSPDSKNRLTKSDVFLETSPREKATNLSPSKSTEAIFKVPLLRCPSTEHLDIPLSIQRSASDCDLKSRGCMPQYTRRWTFSKDSRPQLRKKKSNN